MFVYNMVIEVTRFCNMNCRHCLRGERQRKKFNLEMLNNVFDGIDSVETITFTGGEPLTQINTIIEILEYIRDNHIELGAFYIVSNGTVYSKKLIDVLNDFYQYYVTEQELCSFEISQDEYHNQFDDVRKTNIWKYEELKEYYGYDFIRMKERQKIYSVIESGNAKKNGFHGRKSSFNNGFYPNNDDNFYDTMVYISANGNVISDCDLSFENVDKYSFGNVKNETLKSIIERNTKENVEAVVL